jgi:hypothetical protein
MAAFDFIDSAAWGYRFAWQERRTLLRLAGIPFLVRLASFAVITVLGLEENYLRQGLILIPSYFVEGWMVVQAVRMTAPSAGPGGEDLHERVRSLSAAMILYVLIKLAVSLFAAMAAMAQALPGGAAAAPEPGAGALVAAMAFLFLSLWGFRLLWLYVPVALDYPALDFLRRIRGMTASFSMMAIWLLCFMPIALLLLVVMQILTAVLPPAGALPAQAAAEIAIAVLSSLGIAHFVQGVYRNGDKK